MAFSTARLIAMLASMLVMEGGEMGSWAGPLSAPTHSKPPSAIVPDAGQKTALFTTAGAPPC